MKINFDLDLNLRNILRWFLGVILVWAALGKLANLQEFAATLLAYRMPLPSLLVNFTAIVLPWLELLSGLLLLVNFRLRAALVWTLLLCLAFAICTGQAWLRGLHIACGCLDLRLVGIMPGTETANMLESAGFAFLRSLVLMAASACLLRQQFKSETAP